jgi:hypothetical protein
MTALARFMIQLRQALRVLRGSCRYCGARDWRMYGRGFTLAEPVCGHCYQPMHVDPYPGRYTEN